MDETTDCPDPIDVEDVELWCRWARRAAWDPRREADLVMEQSRKVLRPAHVVAAEHEAWRRRFAA
jgi:hypothetical protein